MIKKIKALPDTKTKSEIDAKPENKVKSEIDAKPEIKAKSEYKTKAAISIIALLFFLALNCGCNENMKLSTTLIKPGVMLEGISVGGKSLAEASKIIEQKEKEIRVNARNAVFDAKTWEVTTPHRTGTEPDIKATIEKLEKSEGNEEINIVTRRIVPSKTSDYYRNNYPVIAAYKTKILDKSPSRLNNIQLASDKINGLIVKPSAEFSFNGTVGKRTDEKGYELAPIIIRTEEGSKKAYGTGGGVCQVATTIYNAAVASGFKITERHEHSKDPAYVPEGKDATVSWGSADLRFVNTGKYPVMIKIKFASSYLYVDFVQKKL